MLNIKNITKVIRGKKIIDNLSLQVDRGQVAILLGASGVGKSTLLRVLNNLETINAGEVYLDGIKLDLNTVNHTHTVGMVFQNFNLFEHWTVQENISRVLETVAHKNTQEAQQIARQLLRQYGLEDKGGLYSSQLSGGQKQRLAIARTLALKPKVVCLDEPTSALDPLLTTSVANTIKELAAQQYIILVATHDIALLEKMACTIHLMHQGTIIESAPSDDFFAHKNEYPAIAAFAAGNSN